MDEAAQYISFQKFKSDLLKAENLQSPYELISASNKLIFNVRRRFCDLLYVPALLPIILGLGLLIWVTFNPSWISLHLSLSSETLLIIVLGLFSILVAISYYLLPVTQKSLRTFQNNMHKSLRSFLITKSTHAEIMRKIINFVESIHYDDVEVFYVEKISGDGPKKIELPYIPYHDLLKFIFHDLGTKPNGRSQFYRAANLFVRAPFPTHPDTPDQHQKVSSKEQLIDNWYASAAKAFNTTTPSFTDISNRVIEAENSGGILVIDDALKNASGLTEKMKNEVMSYFIMYHYLHRPKDPITRIDGGGYKHLLTDETGHSTNKEAIEMLFNKYGLDKYKASTFIAESGAMQNRRYGYVKSFEKVLKHIQSKVVDIQTDRKK